MNRRLLALDPALSCGYAHSCGKQGVWHLAGADGEHPGLRLTRLADHIHAIAAEEGLDELAYEQASFGAIHGKDGRQMVLVQVLQFHAELRAVVKLVAAELQIPFREYAPSTIKAMATGSGRATKDQMLRAHKLQFGFDARTDDEADARFVLELLKQGTPSHAKAKKPKKAGGKRRRERDLFDLVNDYARKNPGSVKDA